MEVWPSRRRVWAFDRETHAQNIQENRVWWARSGKGKPRLKKFRSEVDEGVVPSTWWTRELAGDNQEARRELRQICSQCEIDFPTPKPVRLIRRILDIASSRDCIILDSFAGSGTTGHAVLEANKAQGGNRRFIMVETDTTICRSVTVQRMTNAVTGYTPDNEGRKGQPVPGLGGGFRYCTLAEPLFDEMGNIRPEVAFADLAAHVFFTETGEPIPKRASGRTPLIGQCNGTAY